MVCIQKKLHKIYNNYIAGSSAYPLAVSPCEKIFTLYYAVPVSTGGNFIYW